MGIRQRTDIRRRAHRRQLVNIAGERMKSIARTSAAERSMSGNQNAMPAKTQPPALVRYEAMCKAIAEYHRVDEVKELRDKARALEVYAQQARNTEAEDKAREIRNRAQRRMGELLRELPRMPREERAERTHAILGRGNNNNHDERRTASVLSGESDSESGCMLHDQTCISEHEGCTSNDGTCIFPYAAALEANGISRQMANRYQKLAAIPEKDFEVAIRNPSKKPTTARLIREAYRGPEVREAESVDETARWIWDYTLDFEREGYTSKTPGDLFQTMTPEMQKDMRRLVPVLTDFYQQFSEVI